MLPVEVCLRVPEMPIRQRQHTCVRVIVTSVMLRLQRQLQHIVSTSPWVVGAVAALAGEWPRLMVKLVPQVEHIPVVGVAGVMMLCVEVVILEPRLGYISAEVVGVAPVEVVGKRLFPRSSGTNHPAVPLHCALRRLPLHLESTKSGLH